MGYLMYYLFDSQEHFAEWHANLKATLGYPLEDGITTEYTKLLTKDNGELYAFVDEELAAGLTQTEKPADKAKK
jgi:hypothetical protein